MNKYLVLALFLFALLGCQNRKSKQPEIQLTNTTTALETSNESVTSITESNNNIISMLDELTQKCGFLKMPFSYNYNTGATSGLQCDDFVSTEPYEKLRQKLGCDVIYGVLPDKKGYNAVLVGLAASMMNIELLTIDSVGELIDRKSIMHNHCIHYVEEDLYCLEEVTLSDSFTIFYSYESKYIMYDLEEKADTACDVILQKGIIHENGRIELEELVERNCE